MDFVYESVATLVDDVKRAQRVAEAYHRKYGWPVEVNDAAAFDAPFAAPSAGPPPLPRLRVRAGNRAGLRHRREHGSPFDALGLQAMRPRTLGSYGKTLVAPQLLNSTDPGPGSGRPLRQAGRRPDSLDQAADEAMACALPAGEEGER